METKLLMKIDFKKNVIELPISHTVMGFILFYWSLLHSLNSHQGTKQEEQPLYPLN